MSVPEICPRCREAYPAAALYCPACGRPRTASGDDPLLGTLIAERYLVVERLGDGTSGTIYRVEHTTLRRRYALKLLHNALSADDLSIERFRREATTVGEIDNDHIVEVFDFGRAADKRLFLVMELLEGETLASLLAREGRLPITVITDILAQLGEALMEAHAMGYVHRDLRPRNIFLTTRRGRPRFVKLLDFGLSKLVSPDGEAAATGLGMTFGDARYMSPEQAAGQPVDRRADVYAMGIIAYEMLIGAPPFDGANMGEILTKHLDAVPLEPARARADVPPFLAAIVLKALAKQPAQRFETVYRLVEALREGEKSGPKRPTTGEIRNARLPAAEPPPDPMPPAATSPAVMGMAAAPPPTAGSGRVRERIRDRPERLASQTAVIRVPDVSLSGSGPPATGMSSKWFAEGEQLADGASGPMPSDHSPPSLRSGRRKKGKPTRLVNKLSWPTGAPADSGSGVSSAAFEASAWRRPERRNHTLWIVGGGAAIAVIGLLLGLRFLGKSSSSSAAKPDPPAVGLKTDPPPGPGPGPAGPTPPVTPALQPQQPPQPPQPAGDPAGAAPKPKDPPSGHRHDPPEPVVPPDRSGPQPPVPPPATGPLSESQNAVDTGQRALALGNLQQAEAEFNKARALDVNDVDAIVGLGEVALAGGRAKDAVIHLGEAARRRPNSGRIQRLLADALRKSGDSAGADAAQKRAKALDRVP